MVSRTSSSGAVSLARFFQVCATSPAGGHHRFFFDFSSSLSFFVFSFHITCMICRAFRFQYDDDMALHRLLCLLQNNVSLWRSFVPT